MDVQYYFAYAVTANRNRLKLIEIPVFNIHKQIFGVLWLAFSIAHNNFHEGQYKFVYELQLTGKSQC